MSELLQDQALIWFRCNRRNWQPWHAFKTEFLGFFIPPRYFEHLEDTIRQRLQYPREPFKEYVIALQDLMHHANYNEAEKLTRIYRNSKQEYQLQIKRSEFCTLEQLITLAGDYEAIKHTGNPSPNMMRQPHERNRQVNFVSSEGNINVQTAFYRCGQDGHQKNQCRNPRVLFCWQCGQRGVRTIDCCRPRPGNANGALPQGQGSTQQ